MCDDDYILPNAKVKAYIIGDTLELGTGLGNPAPIRKINANEYVTPNGVTKQFKKHSKNRSENLESIKNSIKRLRRLITHNFSGGKNELWVTLTYRENVTDTKKVYDDFKAFIKKLRRHVGGSDLQYIYVIEPQERGAWHIHLLLKLMSENHLYIENEIVSKKWGHGFVNVKRLKEDDNIAAYVSAYLSDIDVTGTSEEFDDDVEKTASENKRVKKGARLYLYPRGVRLYRKSKMIEQPPEFRGVKHEVMKALSIKNSPLLPKSYYKFDLEMPDGNMRKFEKEFFDIRVDKRWD